MNLPTALLVLDLHAAGVWAEMGDTPFPWDPSLAAPQVVPEPFPAAPQPALERPREEPPILSPRPGLTPPPSPVPAPPAHEAPLPQHFWDTGTPGGILVFLCAEQPPYGDEDTLLRAMLASLGLQDAPIALMGVVGPVEASRVASRIADLKPRQLLILGQDALTTFTGTKVGVEGWHAGSRQGTYATAFQPVLEGMAVGVTYPPALLLRQPLFKRLAWRHLLAWNTIFHVK